MTLQQSNGIVFLKMIMFVPLFAVLWAVLCTAGEPLSEVSADKDVVLITAGKVGEKITERIINWVKWNLAPIRNGGSKDSLVGRSWERMAEDLAKSMRANDLAVLALVEGVTNRTLSEAVHASACVAIVDITALKPKDYDENKDAERYARRLEKECIRTLAIALGLPPCGFPRCAMSPYRTEQELDSKGRNLCPPCQVKAQKILKDKGVTLSFECHVPPFSKNKEK